MGHALRELPAALKLLRAAAGLRQIDLPERGGPPLGTISKLEAGIHRPDTATLEAYLDALGADVHALAAALDQAQGRPPAPPGPSYVAEPLPGAAAALTPVLLAALTATREALELLASRLATRPKP